MCVTLVSVREIVVFCLCVGWHLLAGRCISYTPVRSPRVS